LVLFPNLQIIPMITSLFRLIVKIAVRIFFRKIEVTNLEALPKKGPMIVAANHPSTFMDASVVGSFLKQKPRFLVKGSLFNTAFSKWLLTNMRAIPVQRAQDSPGGKINTSFLFSKCYERLEEGDTILIFPEGVSMHGRQLHKIKTGAARIALGAEAANDFNLGMKIVTIGLNYSNPRLFRSDLYLTIKEPIEVKDWKELYLKDEREASESLTEKIKEQLHDQIIITQDAEEDHLLERIEDVYKGRLLDKFDWDSKDAEANFQASKGLEQALRYFKETDADRVADLKNKLENYFHNLDQLRLNDDLFENTQERSSFLRAGLEQLGYLTFGFPIWLYGFLNNYLPYTLPSRLAYLISKEEGYIAPIMMFIGTLTFPIFYSGQIWAIQEYIGIGWLTILYALSLPLTGLFTLAYWTNVQNTKDQWTLFSKFYKKGDMVAQIIRQRTEIVAVLDVAKLEYLAVLEAEERNLKA
jgi:glycerol-3-phosphate O-acyltransferase/dihydroxyacetone phosphate acyltransferase